MFVYSQMSWESKKKKKCKSVSPSNFALHRPCFTFLSFFLSFFFFFFFVFLIVSDNVSFVGSLSVENVIRSPAKFFSELSSSGPPILPKKKYLAPWSLNAVYCIVWALWRLAGAHVPANSSQICHTDKICPPPPLPFSLQKDNGRCIPVLAADPGGHLQRRHPYRQCVYLRAHC